MADRSARSNVYTVLALIALLAMITAAAFIYVRSGQLFGEGNPFEIRDVKAMVDVVAPLLA